MKHVPVRDVARLPDYAFQHRTPSWWGILGFMVIEGAVFLMAIAVYFYLVGQNPDWPQGSPPPKLPVGTGLAALFVLSELPNLWVKRAAKRQDLKQVRLALIVMSLVGIATLVLRWFELGNLNCRWDTNVYGSVVWMIIVLHSYHIATDTFDTMVTALLMHAGPLEPRRFVGVMENAEYWDFVVGLGLLVYGILYWVPRMILR